MVPIISLLVVLTLSILITRVATVALAHTGLSREAARFQARSAFTGVGFTTTESEKVVNHPVRRRILLLLMLLGNAGIVSAMSSLILTFVSEGDGGSLTLKIVLLSLGVATLWSLSQSQWVDQHLSRLIEKALRRYPQLDVKDYYSLLHLAGGYRVTELKVTDGDWLAGRTLAELDLRGEGLLVLGIERDHGPYIGVPDGETPLQEGDTVIIYGRSDVLEELGERRRGRGGERRHRREVAQQQRTREREKERDPAEEPD